MSGTHKAVVEAIYICPAAGKAMQTVTEVQAIKGKGLVGDRYAECKGLWSGRSMLGSCQVTLIEAEDLEALAAAGFDVQKGQHRRNIVTRGVRLPGLRGKRFRIGQVLMEFDRTRPPCGYLERRTQPGMKDAMRRKGGIGAKVIEGGWIRLGIEIVTADAL